MLSNEFALKKAVFKRGNNSDQQLRMQINRCGFV